MTKTTILGLLVLTVGLVMISAFAENEMTSNMMESKKTARIRRIARKLFLE